MKHLRLTSLILTMALVSASSTRAAVLSDLPYRSGPDAPARCTLDLHLPDDPARAPLLVWFHGGSLTGGHKADPFNLKIAEGFRAQGLAVAMVNYRQSPGVHFPVYVEDAAAAIAWAVRHAADHGLDPARIYVGGHSAGGYLALMATLDPAYLRATDTLPSALRGIISLSSQTLTHGTVLQERAATTPIHVDSAAPLFFAHHAVPPILLLCAERDVPARIEENQLLAALLRRNPANSVTYQTIPDRDHMSILERAADPADPVALALRAFLAR